MLPDVSVKLIEPGRFETGSHNCSANPMLRWVTRRWRH